MRRESGERQHCPCGGIKCDLKLTFPHLLKGMCARSAEIRGWQPQEERQCLSRVAGQELPGQQATAR